MPDESYKFHGFLSPNTTQVPDALFDELLARLSGAELKVLLYIIRRTYGFKKEADNISLNQICKGISTRDGRVLDQGTGLSQSTVLSAVKGLLEKEIILATRRISVERGNEPTTYTLNFGHPFTENRGRGGTKIEEGLPRKSGTQQTVLQETDKQQHVVVMEELTKRGITKAVAGRLADSFPEAYVLAKIDLVDWLVENRPRVVGENPAGFLRKAIQEDYQPPPAYKTPEQRQAEAEQQRRKQKQRLKELELAQQEQERQEQEELRLREQARKALAKEFPPGKILNTDLTTESAWQETLELLQQGMTAANFQTWLKETQLVSCDGSTATIVGPSGYVTEWLATRFRPLIEKQLQQVLGYRVQTKYLALSDLQRPSHGAGEPSGSSPSK